MSEWASRFTDALSNFARVASSPFAIGFQTSPLIGQATKIVIVQDTQPTPSKSHLKYYVTVVCSVMIQLL